VKAILIIATALLLATCAPAPPPLPTGAWSELNNWGNGWGTWTPTPNELNSLPKN
jgi:hypothetical protein